MAHAQGRLLNVWKERLVGRRFGKLTVEDIEFSDELINRSHYIAVCKCDCGNVIRRGVYHLLRDRAKSCGKCGYKESRSSMHNREDLTGKRFGKLIVIGRDTTSVERQWVAKCDCGNEVICKTRQLTSGDRKSCGKCGFATEVLVKRSKMYNSEDEIRLSDVLNMMKQRCYNPRVRSYPNYGAKGVTVCDEWRGPNGTRNFIDWALTNGYHKGLSIDRINAGIYHEKQNGPYAPWNCRWATIKEQNNNTSYCREYTVDGTTKNIAQWAEALDKPYMFLYERASRWPREQFEDFIRKLRKAEAMFSIGGSVDIIKPAQSINFNTDTMYDLLSGSASRGFDGKWYLNAGLSASLTGICGRAGMFKSTFAASLMMRTAAIYDSQVYVADSEDSITRSIERIVRFGGEHSKRLNPDYIVPIDCTTEYDLAKLLKLIQEIGEEKLKNRDAMTITTPFIDLQTNERIRTLLPTVILIDSLSELHATVEDQMISDLTLDDTKVKTAYMADSNAKTLFLRHAKKYAATYGIELVLTAHYGQKLNLDSYLPAPKTLQWGSQNEASKGTGSKFNFLTANLALISSCVKLVADDKSCKYKLDAQTSPTDLSEIAVLMQRCKNNASGLVHPFVVSQENGLLESASNYNYLRNMKAFGFTGNNVTHQCVFLPDVSMTRNSFRGICEKDHRLSRALQLAAQLCYIQNNWSSAGWEFPLKVDPKQLVDVLYSDKNKMSVDRVLHSRGYWLPEEIPSDQEYLSIIDVLEFVANTGMIKSVSPGEVSAELEAKSKK